MNKRRSSTKDSRVKLPRYKVTKKDLKNLEKIIFKYISPADFYIDIGKRNFMRSMPPVARYQFDSAKEVPEFMLRKRPLSVNSKAPNIAVTFNRFSTVVYSGRIFRDGNERRKIDKVYTEVLNYLQSNL